MKIYKFDSKGRNAPAYGCSEPGDNSGEYIKKADILAWLQCGIDDLNTCDPLDDAETAMKQAFVDLISEIEEAGEQSSSK